MAEQMKPSEVDWIGDIPESWKVKPIAYMTKSRSGGTPDRNNLSYWENGTIPWMSSGEVNKVNIYDTDEKITTLAVHHSSAKIISKNAVMVALNGQGKTKGMSAILRTDSACNQSLCAFSCNTGILYYEYLFWCFQTMYTYLRQMSGDDVRDGLAASYVKKQKISIPKYEEQQAIADFLNKECAQIDSIAADLEKQIELLQKYKKSLITETVTKGLDKSVPIKDSGVACIGLVPMSWGYKKLGYMADVTKLAGFEFTNYFEYVDDGVIAIRGLNLKNFDVSLADIQYIPEKTSNMLPRSQVHYNDVLISYAGTVGSVGLITDTAKQYHLAPNVGKVTVFNELIPRYLAYYLISYTGQELIDQLKNKNAQESISMENIRRIKILVPTQIEQQNICDYLDKKTDEIDTLISAQQKKLELMQAYKKSLIYEYVTGKKRVKEVQ